MPKTFCLHLQSGCASFGESPIASPFRCILVTWKGTRSGAHSYFVIQEMPGPQSHLSLASRGVAHRAPLSGVDGAGEEWPRSATGTGSWEVDRRVLVAGRLAVCLIGEAVLPCPGFTHPVICPLLVLVVLTLFCLLLGFSLIRVPICFTCRITTSFSHGSGVLPKGDVTFTLLFSA